MCYPLGDTQKKFGYTGVKLRRESEAKVTELRFFGLRWHSQNSEMRKRKMEPCRTVICEGWVEKEWLEMLSRVTR